MLYKKCRCKRQHFCTSTLILRPYRSGPYKHTIKYISKRVCQKVGVPFCFLNNEMTKYNQPNDILAYLNSNPPFFPPSSPPSLPHPATGVKEAQKDTQYVVSLLGQIFVLRTSNFRGNYQPIVPRQKHSIFFF